MDTLTPSPALAERSGSSGPEAPLSSGSATAASAAVAIPEAFAAQGEPELDANKLHCYHVALELHTLCSTLVASLHRIVRDQLERASLSVVLNIAEAGGRRSRRDKARYYAIARRGPPPALPPLPPKRETQQEPVLLSRGKEVRFTQACEGTSSSLPTPFAVCLSIGS